jgi:hypothetical protein
MTRRTTWPASSMVIASARRPPLALRLSVRVVCLDGG